MSLTAARRFCRGEAIAVASVVGKVNPPDAIPQEALLCFEAYCLQKHERNEK
jgi:hypothetical protein